MGRDPAFLFYPGDWLGGTMTLTRSHKGAYMDLLMAQFNSGRLSNNEIKTVLGLDYETMWNTVLKKKFKVDSDGLFYNEKLENETIKRRNYTANRRDNLRGKCVSHMEPHMNKHMNKHMENINEDVIKDKKEDKKSLEYLESNIDNFRIEEFSDIDIDKEYKKFADYLKSKGKRYKDYPAAFRNWLRSDFVPKIPKQKPTPFGFGCEPSGKKGFGF